MKGKFTMWLFVSAVMIIPIAFFLIVSWYENTQKRLPVISIDANSKVAFSLQNQHGDHITNQDLEGKIVVVDFFFSHCPSICPKMTKNLKFVQTAVKDIPDFQVNSFSIDPERDSVKRLAAYAAQFSIEGNWNLLTGNKSVIYLLARKSFLVDATDGDGGPDDFIHSDKFVLMDKEGRVRGMYNGTDTDQVNQLIKDIYKLRSEKRKAD